MLIKMEQNMLENQAASISWLAINRGTEMQKFTKINEPKLG